MAKHKHYVNLHKKSLFVEREITSLDRVGPAVFFKAKFKNADAMPVSFRVVLVSEVSPYTDAEKKRNTWYALHEPIGLGINEGDEWEADCAALLPPSGGAVYKIEAKAGDKTVSSSDEIETWRRLFFQVFHMKDVAVPNLQPTIDYYKTLFVEWLDEPAGGKTEIPCLENATSKDLFRLVKPQYTVRDREPWVLALVFSNALPSRATIQIGEAPFRGDVELTGRWSGNEEVVYQLPEGKYAWFGIDPADDVANGKKGNWLLSDGTITVDGKDFVIPQASITLDTSRSLRNGHGFNRLKIKLPEAARNQNLIFGKDATFTVLLRVVTGFAGGFALRDENLLTVAATSWWRTDPTPPEKRLQVLNHELGHKLGMVPKGNKVLSAPFELDAPDQLYGDVDLIYAPDNPSATLKAQIKSQNNAMGHRGAHCKRGATGKQKNDDVWKWTGKPDCTMFGATSTETASTPHQFCSECAKLLMRQNLDPADEQKVLSFKSILDT